MNRKLLEEPFDTTQIKKRPGAYGRTLSFVEGHSYIERLNRALDGDWSFRVVEHRILPNEVLVLGELTSCGITKQAFGGKHITRDRESGEAINLSDCLKGATTDSLKKCCSLLGLGLHLYSESESEENVGRQGHQLESGNGNNRTRHGGNGGSRHEGGNGNGTRLTQKQLSAIWSLGRRLNMSADDIRERAETMFGTGPEFLDRSSASSFITGMIDELGGDSYSGGVQ